MFETLTEKLNSAFKTLRGQGRLTEKNISDGLQEIRRALLEADVNYKVVKQFIADVEAAAVGQEVIKSVQPAQQVVKIVHDELVKILGGSNAPLKISDMPPTIIMMVGLQGQGKTTTTGKLAVQLKKKGRKPLLVAADVYRPAAVKQLEVVAQQAGVEFFGLGTEVNPVDICVMAQGEAQMRGCDTILLDTAGRLHVDDQMMAEVRQIAQAVRPHEILFVANATTGQDAVNSAKQFKDNLPLTGVILTQMDGDARGGAALSLITVTGCPIKFVGTGEKLDALEAFHPERMAGQILGMGDIVSFVEKAQEVVDQEKALKFQEKARKAEWNLEDFFSQMQEVKKLGSIGDLMKKIPGMSQLMGGQEMNFDEGDMKHIEAIIQSMTVEERQRPKIIAAGRRRRIADGSGTTLADVNRLLKDFEKSRQMMKEMMKRGGKGGKRGGPFGGGRGMPMMGMQ